MEKSTRERLRAYQHWQGNEVFFCCGHCIAGPNWPSAIASILLVAVPSILFISTVALWLGEHVSQVIVVVSCLLPACSMLWFFTTACRDPGILPRLQPDAAWRAGRKPRTQDVLVNGGHRVTVRYNDTCHFYQPPRAHHCSVNNNCIERFDHHCPWLGTTVGLRNYRTFLLFIYNTTLLLMWTFGCCMTQMLLKYQGLRDRAAADGRNLFLGTVREAPAAFILMLYTFIFFWFIGGLSAFHCYLLATNQTTYENFRYGSTHLPNPYDQGCLSNCLEVWCTKVPPGRINFRAYIDADNMVGSIRLPCPPGHSDLSSSDSDTEGSMSHEGSQQHPPGAIHLNSNHLSRKSRAAHTCSSGAIGGLDVLLRESQTIGVDQEEEDNPVDCSGHGPSVRLHDASPAPPAHFAIEQGPPPMQRQQSPRAAPLDRMSKPRSVTFRPDPQVGEAAPDATVSRWYRNWSSPTHSGTSSPYGSPLFDYRGSRMGRDMFQSVIDMM